MYDQYFTDVVVFSLVLTFKWVNVNSVRNDDDFHVKCFSFSFAGTIFTVGVECCISLQVNVSFNKMFNPTNQTFK